MEDSPDKHNKGGMIAFIFSIAFCLIFFVYISFIHPGVDLKEVAEEVPAAEAAPGAAPAINMSKVEKPWAEDEAVAAHGKKVYSTNCAICHGAEGKGDGAAGAGLNPKPRNLVEGKWKVGGDSIALFKTLQNGIPGGSMASFKHLPKSDRWALVQFVRSITSNKEKDDPAALDKFGPTAE